jgi:hypothetical protein
MSKCCNLTKIVPFNIRNNLITTSISNGLYITNNTTNLSNMISNTRSDLSIDNIKNELKLLFQLVIDNNLIDSAKIITQIDINSDSDPLDLVTQLETKINALYDIYIMSNTSDQTTYIYNSMSLFDILLIYLLITSGIYPTNTLTIHNLYTTIHDAIIENNIVPALPIEYDNINIYNVNFNNIFNDAINNYNDNIPLTLTSFNGFNFEITEANQYIYLYITILNHILSTELSENSIYQQNGLLNLDNTIQNTATTLQVILPFNDINITQNPNNDFKNTAGNGYLLSDPNIKPVSNASELINGNMYVFAQAVSGSKLNDSVSWVYLFDASTAFTLKKM